jgi:hypothetical protein
MFFQIKKRNFIFNWGINIVLISVAILSNNFVTKIIFILIFLILLVTECFSKNIYSISISNNNTVSFRIRDYSGFIDRKFKYNLSDISYSYKTVPYNLGVQKQLKFFNGNKLIGKINEHETDDTSLDQLVNDLSLMDISVR